ncbi:MAG: hypothetical protein IMW90_16225 [Thermogemmatispora sp.]|uniref:hypothetical protein n=1 Tax=Thermogemmatispora TaxID=768669 RepID=UPI00124EA111|nr:MULTISPECIES: hypothetical protein [Thermogemmatispora]MBE3567264.1 hypothetical protein [Thermogemmatispora sp.]
MLAQEVAVLDGDSPLWERARGLLNAALLLEQQDEGYVWHGWTRGQIEAFLHGLPSPCCLVVAVWQAALPEQAAAYVPDGRAAEQLMLGLVCEVVEGEVRSLRTFEALRAAGLKAVDELEPGYEDGLAILRAAHALVAPVAWALFTDWQTWNEWLYGSDETQPSESVVDKGALLTALAQAGRCVLLGTQTAHRYL